MNTSKKSIKILGLSFFYHDSAAAITQGSKIVAAAQEERFTRKKQDPGFPSNAVKYCLEHSGLSIDDLDAVVFYDKPLLKFERLLEWQEKGVCKIIAKKTWYSNIIYERTPAATMGKEAPLSKIKAFLVNAGSFILLLYRVSPTFPPKATYNILEII